MASREHRRMVERKKAGDKTQAELRRERHPIFYWITFIVLIVVVVAFIGSGIIGGVATRDRYVFGKYGNEEIEVMRGGYSALNYFTSQLDILSQQNDNPEQLRSIYTTAFNNTMTHYAILDIVGKSGYEVSKRRLDREITNHQEFQTNGRFDERKYQETSDMEKSLLKKFIRELIFHDQYINDVFFSQRISSGEIDFFKEMKGTERKFSYVSYRYSDFPEEKVAAYGQENIQLFKKMRLSRIFLTNSSEKEAEEIRNQVVNKVKSFEEMAREKSKGIYAEKGGDMGSQYYYQIQGFLENEEDVQHIFSLKNDELSRVIKNGDNFEIYRSNSVVSEPDFSDEALLKTVREYMMRYQKDIIEEYSVDLATTFKEKSDESSFDDACRELDIYPPHETEFFPLNYLDIFPTKEIKPVDADSPSLIAATGSEDFFVEAFGLAQDEVSNPVRLDDQVVVLKMIEEKTLTEDDWQTENIIFQTSLQYQNNFAMRMLLNQISTFIVKHQQGPQLFSHILAVAEEEKIPYEYAFNVFLNKNNDLENLIEELKQENAVNHFDETFAKLFRVQPR